MSQKIFMEDDVCRDDRYYDLLIGMGVKEWRMQQKEKEVENEI
jgi:hypothetical protein